MMREGYKSIKDILTEVAEEEGMTYRELKDVWNHQKHYIKKLMDKENIYAIFLPTIGTLSLNTKQADREKRGKDKSYYKSFLEKVEALKNHENYRTYKNSHKRVTGVNRLYRYINSTYETGTEEKKLSPHKECWNTILKYSNNVYKKKDK